MWKMEGICSQGVPKGRTRSNGFKLQQKISVNRQEEHPDSMGCWAEEQTTLKHGRLSVVGGC